MFDFLDSLWGSLASAGAGIVTDMWTAICMSFWGASLWLMNQALSWSDSLLSTPVDGQGMAPIYSITLWLASIIAVVLLICQVIAAGIKQDGRTIGQAILGTFKFLLVCGTWIGYAAALLTAVNAVTRAVRESLFNISDPSDWQIIPGGDAIGKSISGATATLLLFMSLLLFIGAFAYIIMLLGRAVSLVILVATAPIAAAGLIYGGLEQWFWKLFRWFHAAAFAPLLVTLILGMGVQLTTNTALGNVGDGTEAVGMVVPGVMMFLIASVSPMALFRFLAFVDPGTSSGAAFRASNSQQKGEKAAEQPAAANSSTTESINQTRTSAVPTSSVGAASPGAAGAPGTPGAAGSAGASAGGGGRALGGALGAGAVIGSTALGAAKTMVNGFKTAGAWATGVASDVGSMSGSDHQNYPHDPRMDRVGPVRGRRGRRSPAIIDQEGASHGNDNVH